MNILGKRSDLPFSRKSDRKKEKSTVSFTHVQNIICSQTQLDGIAHEHTIICRQLFAGQVVGSWPMKRKRNLPRMIITFIFIHLLLQFKLSNESRNNYSISVIVMQIEFVVVVVVVTMCTQELARPLNHGKRW